MKSFATPLLFFATSICGIACSNRNAWAQETQRQKQEQSSQQNQYRDQAQSSQQEQQQHAVQTYNGQVSSKHGNCYLQEAHSRAAYLLQDTWEAKRFTNKKVRITGWLDTDKNILHVVSMAPSP